jgi:hypothetical protein
MAGKEKGGRTPGKWIRCELEHYEPGCVRIDLSHVTTTSQILLKLAKFG